MADLFLLSADALVEGCNHLRLFLNVLDRFGQHLPFTTLAASLGGKHFTKFIKQFLHFFSSLAFGKLVAYTQLRRP